jgi:hypothetical protein
MEKPKYLPYVIKKASFYIGPQDEDKAKCIWCGEEWYIIHHKDGVCNSCQKKNLPGLRALENRSAIKTILVLFIITIAIFAILDTE